VPRMPACMFQHLTRQRRDLFRDGLRHIASLERSPRRLLLMGSQVCQQGAEDRQV